MSRISTTLGRSHGERCPVTQPFFSDLDESVDFSFSSFSLDCSAHDFSYTGYTLLLFFPRREHLHKSKVIVFQVDFLTVFIRK